MNDTEQTIDPWEQGLLTYDEAAARLGCTAQNIESMTIRGRYVEVTDQYGCKMFRCMTLPMVAEKYRAKTGRIHKRWIHQDDLDAFAMMLTVGKPTGGKIENTEDSEFPFLPD
jgi:hypothetical protein